MSEGLRPTPERVRETVYDWLDHLFGSWDGRRVLDMYAGSGAMGFEAASRGALSVDWVDTNRNTLKGIRQTLEKLGVSGNDNYHTHAADGLVYAGQDGHAYDFIVIDPPYKDNAQERAVIAAKGRLKPEGLIYVESPQAAMADEKLSELGLVRVRLGTTAASAYELLALHGSHMATLARLPKEKKGKNR